MHFHTFIVLCGLLAAGSASAQAYKWVDEDGVTHYSDRPVEGAEQVQLSEYTRSTGARLFQANNDDADDADAVEEPVEFRYENIEIASPGAEETLWNIEGQLNVSVSLTPGLQSGHQVRVFFDGEPRMVRGTSFQIDEVWRGVHNVQAEVLDETGKVVARSKANRFYVQQNTVNTVAR